MNPKLMFVFLTTAATAIAAPAPGPQPPPLEKLAWLGITTREAPPVIGAQMDLPKGTGLVVDMVIPASPAATAGVQANDVLTKLDDQLLINPPQLAVLVRMKKAGDKVQLTLLRKGKTQTVPVTLSEHEVPEMPAGNGPHVDPNAFFKGFVPMRDGQAGPAGGAWVMPNGPGSSVIIQSEGGDANTALSTSQFSDGEHTITIQGRDGKKTVTVAGKDGKAIYSGPYDTAADKAKVPPEVAGKLKQMEENQQRIPHEMFAPPPLAPEQL
jgi:hypothetical protein